MAVVIADTPEDATHAASLFDLEYVEMSPTLHAEDAMVSDLAANEPDAGSVTAAIYPNIL